LVRINLVKPCLLSDQHLIAEKNEIGMLFGYVRKYPAIKPNEIPRNYTLSRGHIKFFKNKLLYLYNRELLIRKEMNNRGFKCGKLLDLKCYNKEHLGDWKPKKSDYIIIIDRIGERLLLKPEWYRYNKMGLNHVKAEKMIERMKNLYL
jgi:deoxyribonuclease (pyrimidine dimer)